MCKMYSVHLQVPLQHESGDNHLTCGLIWSHCQQMTEVAIVYKSAKRHDEHECYEAAFCRKLCFT